MKTEKCVQREVVQLMCMQGVESSTCQYFVGSSLPQRALMLTLTWQFQRSVCQNTIRDWLLTLMAIIISTRQEKRLRGNCPVIVMHNGLHLVHW